MTKDERNQIRQSAADKHKGNLEAAACEFLGADLEYKKAGNKVPAGFDASVHAIVLEVETYAEQDAEGDAPAAPKTSGKTSAKSKKTAK